MMRLTEVFTETIDVAGLAANAKREARLVLSGGTVWAEDKAPVQVTIRIEADPLPELEINLEDADLEDPSLLEGRESDGTQTEEDAA